MESSRVGLFQDQLFFAV